MSLPTLAQVASGLGMAMLAVGAVIWWRVLALEEISRARRMIDRAVLEALREGPRFSHALADEVAQELGSARLPGELVRASAERLEMRGLVRSSESGFLAPSGPGREPQPRRIYRLTRAGVLRTSGAGSAGGARLLSGGRVGSVPGAEGADRG